MTAEAVLDRRHAGDAKNRRLTVCARRQHVGGLAAEKKKWRQRAKGAGQISMLRPDGLMLPLPLRFRTCISLTAIWLTIVDESSLTYDSANAFA